MKKLWLVLIIGMLFLSLVGVNVLASELSDEVKIFFDADINVNLPEVYNAGDVVDGVISVDNREDFPIVDGFIVIEVLKGCEEPIYPSQFSDCDNIFDEIVIDKINVPGSSAIEVPFSYVLRDDLSPGTYRMDFAFRTEKTPIVGMPHILLSSKYQFFELTGNGSFPYASIMRTRTNINDETGPIGVGVVSGEDFTLDVYVDSEKVQAATLEVSICDWQDSVCDLISSETKNVNLEIGEQLISVGLKVPDSPDAYAIRIELKDSNGLVSLYRSRLVVFGSMAKVRKLFTDNYYYSGGKMKISVLVAASPDHYTRPVVEDIFLKVTVTDLVGDNVVGVETLPIGNLDADNLFAEADFEIDVVGKLYEFETCAELTNSKTNELYEKYCYITNANNFPSLVHDVKLTGVVEEDRYKGSVCVYGGITGEAVDSELFVSVREDDLIVSNERKVVDNCMDLEFGVDKGKGYDVLVQDMRTNQDFEFNVNKGVLGVSLDIWIYVVLVGVLIFVATVVIISLAAKNKRRLPK